LPSEGETPAAVASSPDGQGAAVADARIGSDATRPVSGDAPTFHRDAERRLRRWHRRIVADWKAFDELDDAGLHALRKRVKRQRYAVEFFASVLRHRKVERYLKPLAAIQDRMGELNDLFVARTRYQGLVEVDPAAWFALGWLAARIVAVRALAKPGLGRLAEVNSPRRCG
jgi:CHAD domain-containing protein